MGEKQNSCLEAVLKENREDCVLRWGSAALKNFYRQLKSEVMIIVWQNPFLSLLPDFTYRCRKASSQLDCIFGCSIWITILQRGIIYLKVINRDKKGQGVPLCAVRWTNLMIGIMQWVWESCTMCQNDPMHYQILPTLV